MVCYAFCEAHKPYGEILEPWEKNPLHHNLEPARALSVNDVQKVRVSPSQLLTCHKLWTTLDYATVEKHDVRGNLEWTVERAGTSQGNGMWFDAGLAERIGFFKSQR